MSVSFKIQRLFVVFVLIVHVGWIVNHLRWVANDQVNPWKLGGYGMYTVPSPEVRVELNKVSRSGAVVTLDPASYDIREFQRSFANTNSNRVFRCAPVKARNIRAFFDQNPQLLGADLVFVFTERQFSRDPVALQRREQGRVQIQWIGYSDLVYGSSFCGRVETGELSWS